MSPRKKLLAVFSVLGIVCVSLYYIPSFFCLALFLVPLWILCYYKGVPRPASLGPNPRTRFAVPPGLWRGFLSWLTTGVSTTTQERNKSSRNGAEEGQHFVAGAGGAGIYRKEQLESESFLFNPQDYLMGSYIAKPHRSAFDVVKPRSVNSPREQLHDGLTRSVYTPRRRLSFAGEPARAACRFTITPLRHYPLLQPGASPVGVLPPVKWGSFKKKIVLSPRKSAAALSPVTVKIARPNNHQRSPSIVDHSSCAEVPRPSLDPCSRESVLTVLKKSHKRALEDEDEIFATEQRIKRRRNDSGGSAHSAFGPLLPNGTPSQLVPKPGSLKRRTASLVDEPTTKRSRTSSISSVGGVHATKGTPGTTRNPIHSSYSSTGGMRQMRKRIAPSPSLSCPGSPRSQTPETASKKFREDDGQSPSSSSSLRSDHAAFENTPVTSILTPAPKLPGHLSSDTTPSGGTKRRKIPILWRHDNEPIILPPPPELGYTVTAKDLDDEKKAAMDRITKFFANPDPGLEKAASKPPPTTTLSSLLAAPLSSSSTSPSTSTIPVINLDPSTSKVSASTTFVQPSCLQLTTSTAATSLPQSSSAFAQVLAQVSKAPAGASSSAGATPIASIAPSTSLASAPVSSSNPLLTSGFKPIFAVTPTTSTSQVSKPVQAPTVSSSGTLVFGGLSGSCTTGTLTGFPVASTAANCTPASSSITTTAQTAPQPAIKSLFVNLSTPASTGGGSPSVLAPATQDTLQFGLNTTTAQAAVASVTSIAPATTQVNSTFAFGVAKPESQNANQKMLALGQATLSQNTTTASFGGFAMTTTASTTVAPSNQSTPSLSKAMFQAPASQTSFGSSAVPQPTFGSSTAPQATFGSSAVPQATFGSVTTTQGTFGSSTAPKATFSSATTTQATFGSSTAPKATFGSATTTQATFGSSTAPKATFGSATTTQSTFGSSTTPHSTFGSSTAPKATFGSATTTQATFGSATTTQATFVSSTAPQATFVSSTAPQATFGSSTAPQATFGSSTAPQATFGSSTTPQATFGSSTTPQATFGSSTTPQATFGSSTAPQATFGPATTTQATFGSSTAPQATFGSSTAPQATFGSSTAPKATFGPATTTQATFGSATTTQATFGSSTSPPPKTFTFGGASSAAASNNTPAPFTFGAAAATTASTFGTSAKPSFGGASTGFAFGGNSASAAAPNFGASSQTQSSTPAAFTFGGGAAQQVPSSTAKSAPSGFAFSAVVPQFGTPVSNNPSPQIGNFNFGAAAAAADKPAFGTSTPAFGQSVPGPIPFGSPGTPVQGFNPAPFGSPATPSFSIGAGSKPSGARQRLQARRQHNRKK